MIITSQGEGEGEGEVSTQPQQGKEDKVRGMRAGGTGQKDDGGQQ